MKIYDCFTFFNELDILDIRLNTLDEVVDHFVLVESKKTFTNNDKPLFYLENMHLFKKFQHKIIHIILNESSSETNAWQNEEKQRNAIRDGLTDCVDSDIIMVSDVDEIPNPDKIELINYYIDNKMVFDFSQRLYYYYLNMLVANDWKGTKLCTFAKFKEFSPQSLRMNSVGNTLIENGGWHFSYMGGAESIKYKIESFSHQEVNTDEIKNNIDIRLTEGVSIFDKNQLFHKVNMDSIYPKYILNNLEKFKHLIKQ